MSKHTPGPWFIPTKPGSKGGIAHAGGYVAFTAPPRKVSDERRDGESWLEMRERTQSERDAVQAEEKANTHLMVAAPDLLALAREVADNIVLSGTRIGAQARAAIAKATGAP